MALVVRAISVYPLRTASANGRSSKPSMSFIPHSKHLVRAILKN